MKTIDFNIKFREKIEKGTYKVTWNNLPVRIICWDRKGARTPDATTPLPILALADCGVYDKILRVTEDGTAFDIHLTNRYFPLESKLQVTYQDLPNKLTRVKYCLAKADVFTDNLMKEYGYTWDNNKSYYYNRIAFINSYSKRYMNQFYRKLKLSDHWEYDDEEDWNLNFKEGDYVECIYNDGPWVLTIGDIYKIIYIEQPGRITIESIKDDRALTIGETDFIDMFKHSDSDKKELEKIEPKFHEGDYLEMDGRVLHITEIAEDGYITEDCEFIPFSICEEEAHLWSIQDAKDGDVLFTSSTASHETFVFKGIDEKGNVKCYFAYDSEDGFREGTYHFIGRATKCKPATKEWRDLLFQKMKGAGYEWNDEKKELKKINDKFDFSTLKPFTPVLARTGDHQTWFPYIYVEYRGLWSRSPFIMLNMPNEGFAQCVPFEGNEHLMGTIDPIPPYYDIRKKK